ncbi:hypothetical protein MRB53_041226 [Persea americana]|nr:hypothetical protein MRB53_041226 [Persea americana]
MDLLVRSSTFDTSTGSSPLPLLLTDLLLTAGLPAPTILYTILIDEIMIVTGIGLVLLSHHHTTRIHANHLGKDIGRVFLMTGAWTGLLWTLYPIAWGVSEGGNVIHPDSEAVFYGVLDILAKPVFGAILLFGHRNIDPARLGLHIRDYDEKDFSHRPGATQGVCWCYCRNKRNYHHCSSC